MSANVGGRYRFGTIATHSCNKHWERKDGSRLRRCRETGNWDGTRYRCKRSKLNIFKIIMHTLSIRFQSLSHVFEISDLMCLLKHRTYLWFI